jgi:hypothetical protein
MSYGYGAGEDEDQPWYSDLFDSGGQLLDGMFKSDGDLDLNKILAVIGGIGGAQGWFDSDQKSMGYQGKIPSYTASRGVVPGAQSGEGRRPGGEGQQYFSDTYYGTYPEGAEPAPLTVGQAQDAAHDQAQALQPVRTLARGGLASLDRGGQGGRPLSGPGSADMVGQLHGLASMAQPVTPQMPVQPQAQAPALPPVGGRPTEGPGSQDWRGQGVQQPTQYDGFVGAEPTQAEPYITDPYGMPLRSPDVSIPTTTDMEMQGPTSFAPEGYTEPSRTMSGSAWGGSAPQGFAQGGIAGLLGGASDGMSDQIPTTIGGQQPAALSGGEFVFPADAVSHLGNGSTEAGAQQLYKMMERIREARTGKGTQAKQINPQQFMAS